MEAVVWCWAMVATGIAAGAGFVACWLYGDLVASERARGRAESERRRYQRLYEGSVFRNCSG